MRLLDTATYQLHDFTSGKKKPPYAILSHCWEDDEVSFQLMRDSQMTDQDEALKEEYDSGETTSQNFPILAEMGRYHRGRLMSRKGWQKITRFCDEARRREYHYAWVDTCCIDKSSSAELQEAINSMWKWYEESEICIIYMHDFRKPDKWQELRDCRPAEHPAESPMTEGFKASKWFTRGWTLQELLAPRALMFVDQCWEELGDIRQLFIAVAAATGIAEVVFHGLDLKLVSVADKMSWMANRSTTREEDESYCLLGLFKINMPLLYGEGAEAAFRRFQDELISRYADETMFVWNNGSTQRRNGCPRMLAERPSNFKKRFDCSYRTYGFPVWIRPPFWRSYHGIHIDLHLEEISHNELVRKQGLPSTAENVLKPSQKVFVAPLRCEVEHVRTRSRSTKSYMHDSVLTVYIVLLAHDNAAKLYFRVKPDLIMACKWEEHRRLYPLKPVVILDTDHP